MASRCRPRSPNASRLPFMPNSACQCNAIDWHSGQGPAPPSGVFLVALEQLDRNPLRAADEADADAGPDCGRLARELDTLGLDLGGDRVDVLHRQPEMIEPLIGRHRRHVDAITWLDLGDEDVGAAELDVDATRAADNDAAENILKPRRGCLRIGAAQMDMVPGNDRHSLVLPCFFWTPLAGCVKPLAAGFRLSGSKFSGGVAAWPSRCAPRWRAT